MGEGLGAGRPCLGCRLRAPCPTRVAGPSGALGSRRAYPTTIGFALQLLQELPGLTKVGVDVTRMVTEGTQKLHQFDVEGRNPSAAEWEALNAEIKRLRGELHAG